MVWLDQFILLLVSLVANLMSAFAGGGAGLLQLPALIFLGLPFGVALATHKIASVALGIGATLRNVREKSVDLRLASYTLLCGVPGVVLGASVILRVPEHIATFALGVLICGLGIYSMFKPQLGQQESAKHRDTRGYLLGGAVLFCIGILNGSLTAGSGLFFTLWLVLWFGLDYRRAIAHTLVVVGLGWNGTGAIVLGAIGQVQWDWLPALLLGSLLGGYLGAALAIRFGNRWIKRGFELVTVLVGVKLMLG